MVDVIDWRGFELSPGGYEFDDLYDLLVPDNALDNPNYQPLNTTFAIGSQEPEIFDQRLTPVGLSYAANGTYQPDPIITSSQRTMGTQPAGLSFAGGVETFSEEIYPREYGT